MANPEHLKILKKGVEYWNKWRKENPNIIPDLYGADLRNVNLLNANFAGANLENSDLRNAFLLNANFAGANLKKTYLDYANFENANLESANLKNSAIFEVKFIYTNFNDANLEGTLLFFSFFLNNELRNMKISNASLEENFFINVDFSSVIGLSEVKHYGPSFIDISTLYKSQGKIPENFLRGTGVPEDFILNHIPSIGIKPIEFYSCFISYSHKDNSFSKKLYERLQMSGIRCWLDEKQMLPGDDIYERVDRGIRLWDKVLLCASEHSLTSWWVDNEIRTAFDKEQKIMKERKKKIHALIPLNLDGYMFSDEWKSGYKQQVKERLAPNFKGWNKDNDLFEREVENVIKALRTDREIFDVPPEKKL